MYSRIPLIDAESCDEDEACEREGEVVDVGVVGVAGERGGALGPTCEGEREGEREGETDVGEWERE